MITWLESIIEKNNQLESNSSITIAISAANLLASLNGWKIQHCSRQGRVMRDSRLNQIGPSKR
ncbi:MAG: hypothetical protein ACXAC5_05440 [Promethearchaeota archaeon]